MCGIVGYVGGRETSDVLVEGLKKLEYRGYDSSGISVLNDSGIKTVKSKGRLSDLEALLSAGGKPQGSCGIGHTRWATHGAPSDVNSHPHNGKALSLVHNGIIENYLEIKEFLTEKGYSFLSETDTETVAKLIDFFYEGDPFSAICKAIGKIRGSYALGILFNDFPGKLFAVRKDSPLIVGLGEGENFIASDIPAILKYTKKYYLLDDNQIVTVSDSEVTVKDLSGNTVSCDLHVAEWDIEAAEKDGYPHFMLKEIFEQPTALERTVNPRISEDGLPSLSLSKEAEEVLSSLEKIHIVACGTAMHAGLVGRNLIEGLVRIPVAVDIASEFRYRNPIIGKNDLVVIVSQSGETADSLAALRLAKESGAHTLAIVNVVGSSIAREADSVVYTWAGPEIAVASTKAYSVQVSVFYLLAFRLALLKGTLSAEQVREYLSVLKDIPSAVENSLSLCEKCESLASEFTKASSLFFIGRGLDHALACEASLKLKEISYIHSEAYAAGELKHGTISLITDGVPVFAVATQDALFEKTLSNIKEVKARGARVVLLCKKGMAQTASSVADEILEIPDLPDIFTALPVITLTQLFAYYSSVIRGNDVDKPRNLAKSVTVE